MGYENSGRIARVKRTPQCPSSFVAQATDTDMSGDLIGQSRAASIDGCCTLCEEAEVCEGFAYLGQICYLKTNFSGVYYHLGAVTRITASAASPDDFEPPQSNRDLAGVLLEEWFAPLPELCMASCARKADCGGFVFYDKRCYLKGDVEGTYENAGRITHVKRVVQPPANSTPQCPSSFVAEATDTDMSGDLIGQSWAASIDGCCTLCEEAEACEGFAYLGQICYLKTNFTGVYYHLGAVTRLTTSAASPDDFEPAQSNRDLAGTLLEEWFAPLPELCMASCARKADCGGFVFYHNRCYLKGNVEGFYDNSGRTTRVKRGVLPGGRRLIESNVMV